MKYLLCVFLLLSCAAKDIDQTEGDLAAGKSGDGKSQQSPGSSGIQTPKKKRLLDDKEIFEFKDVSEFCSRLSSSQCAQAKGICEKPNYPIDCVKADCDREAIREAIPCRLIRWSRQGRIDDTQIKKRIKTQIFNTPFGKSLQGRSVIT